MLEYIKWGENMEKNIESKPQPKKVIKKRRIKEILFIVSMIICLGIGFIFGYIINNQNNNIIKSSGDTTILDEAYHILKMTGIIQMIQKLILKVTQLLL